MAVLAAVVLGLGVLGGTAGAALGEVGSASAPGGVDGGHHRPGPGRGPGMDGPGMDGSRTGGER